MLTYADEYTLVLWSTDVQLRKHYEALPTEVRARLHDHLGMTLSYWLLLSIFQYSVYLLLLVQKEDK